MVIMAARLLSAESYLAPGILVIETGVFNGKIFPRKWIIGIGLGPPCVLAYNPIRMKTHSEYIEGPEATSRFDALVRKVLSVPHSEIMRRDEAYRRQSLANPNRRGPKPKVKPST